MTYVVDFSVSDTDLFYGLVNHENTGGSDESLWDLAVYRPREGDATAGSSLSIAPTSNWGNGRFVLKKQLACVSGSFTFNISGTTSYAIYIDGELVADGSGNHVYTHVIQVGIGMHCVSFMSYSASRGHISFDIKDGADLRDTSDLTWPCLTVGKLTDEYKQEVKRHWADITPDTALTPFDPVAVADGTHVYMGELDPATITRTYNDVHGDIGNHWEQTWARSVYRSAGDWGTGGFTPVAVTWNFAWEWSFQYFRKHVHIKKDGMLHIRVAGDDQIDGYVNGVHRVHVYGQNQAPNSAPQPVKKGDIVLISFRCYNERKGGWAAFGVFLDGETIAHSGEYWGAMQWGRADVPGVPHYGVAEVLTQQNIVEGGNPSVLKGFYKDNGEEFTPAIHTTALSNNGDGTETKYWYVVTNNILRPFYFEAVSGDGNNTHTVLRSTAENILTDVTVKYNRMDLQGIFSRAPIALRELELDMEGTHAELNERIFVELTRRYNVNFTSADFALYRIGTNYTIQAKASSLSYIGRAPFTVIASLTTRVPNVDLVGFTKENSDLAVA